MSQIAFTRVHASNLNDLPPKPLTTPVKLKVESGAHRAAPDGFLAGQHASLYGGTGYPAPLKALPGDWPFVPDAPDGYARDRSPTRGREIAEGKRKAIQPPANAPDNPLAKPLPPGKRTAISPRSPRAAAMLWP